MKIKIIINNLTEGIRKGPKRAKFEYEIDKIALRYMRSKKEVQEIDIEVIK